MSVQYTHNRIFEEKSGRVLLTDNLVWDCAIDDTNDIPERSGGIFLLIVQVHNHVVWCRPDIVLHTLVLQACVSCPVLVELSSLGSVAIEGFENRKSIQVRNWD